MKKSTGINVPIPKTAPKEKDAKDPFFGDIALRGRQFTGKVISDKMARTVTVQWERKKYISKYERYIKAKSRVKAHNPESLNAKTGDMVRIMETRPISKTKKFVVVEIIGDKKE